MTGSVVLGRVTVGGSCNLRAGGSFSIDAFFASGVFVGSFACSLGVIVGAMPPVASGTALSRPCPSWLEPISKSPEEDNQAGELDKAQAESSDIYS